MIDLRQLKYFVVVAEEEHVGRAAERLHISQSPLSRQIAQLEERLGLTLFERNQQRIRLTADGQTFLAETRSLLTHANRLESLGKRLGRGKMVACVLAISKTPCIPVCFLRRYVRYVYRVRMCISHFTANHRLPRLKACASAVSIFLVDTPPTDSEQDLEYIQVLDDRMLLALPQNHPLAQEENLVASQLGDEQWIAVIHNDDAHSRDHFVAACVNAGFNPDIRLEAGEPLTALGLVAAGLGLALIQHSLRHNAPEGVVLRELPWMNYSTQLWAAWHKANQRPLVSHFRQILRGE